MGSANDFSAMARAYKEQEIELAQLRAVKAVT